MSTGVSGTDTAASLRVWSTQLRIHQWAKNGLVFVPLFASQKFDRDSVTAALLAFVSFSLLASATYIGNDVVDRHHDRQHSSKRNRPIASGLVSMPLAVGVAIGLAIGGFAVAWFIGIDFTLALGFYLLATAGYSLFLKRIVFADVVLLATLYTVRVVAGALAINSSASVWILVFSSFIFLSLALVKRYSEIDKHDVSTNGRGYVSEDLTLVMSAGIASGLLAVLVFALYIDSPTVTALYASPEFLWIYIPLLMFWVMRIWGVTIRGDMHDDPIIYALRDLVSQMMALVLVLITFAATVIS